MSQPWGKILDFLSVFHLLYENALKNMSVNSVILKQK